VRAGARLWRWHEDPGVDALINHRLPAARSQRVGVVSAR
jgi:hypothetical protein